MAEKTQVVRLYSPEEVAKLKATWEKYAEFDRLEFPDALESSWDAPMIRLIYTLEAAWETIDRLQGTKP